MIFEGRFVSSVIRSPRRIRPYDTLMIKYGPFISTRSDRGGGSTQLYTQYTEEEEEA